MRAQASTNIKELEGALERFRMDNSRYPTQEEGLHALVEAPSDAPNWRGPYVKEIPPDPWHREFQYITTDGDPVIISYGADGAEGGDGNNADITNAPSQPSQ
jgi:general secretion pathway protein G